MSEDKIPQLIQKLKAGDNQAYQDLVEIGAPAVDFLCLTIEKNRDATTRFWAANALGEIGDERAVAQLLGSLGDVDDLVRGAASRALGEIGGAMAVTALCALLESKDPEDIIKVRGLALQALVRIRDARSAEPLCRVLDDDDLSDQQSCRDIARALAEIGTPAVKPLCHLLQSGRRPMSRSYAAIALGDIMNAESIEPLCRALKDKESSVRYWAAQALGNIGQRQALPALKARLWSYPRTVDTLPGDFIASNGSGAS
jgi:HEAT repeat protein